MTKLLISVRNAKEAALALSGGADLIDVKEPRHGSLGAPERTSVKQVVSQISGKRPLSIAMGDLPEVVIEPAHVAGVNYAKVGMAGCQNYDWQQKLTSIFESIPKTVARVAVVYADWRHASAPETDEVFAAAKSLNCVSILLDTWDKSRGGLLKIWSLSQIATFVEKANAEGLVSLIGGSLDLGAIQEILPLAPDFVAVRGAACRGSRSTTIVEEKVCQLATLTNKQDRWLPISCS